MVHCIPSRLLACGICLLVAALAALPAVDLPSGPPAGSGPWVQTFSDDFNGTALDTSKWSTGYGWGNITGFSQEYADPRNVRIADGKLSITVENRAQNGRRYTSGAVNTKNKFSQQYGYFESRIRMARGKGLLNAWWGKRNDESWPPEIDIIEVLGSEPRTAHMTIHYDQNGHKYSSGSSQGPDFTTTFNTFGCLWEPDRIIWYINGVEVRRLTTANAPLHLINQTFYWMLTVHIGASWPGYPDASNVWPATFEVDWVRAWQKGTSPDPVPATLPAPWVAADIGSTTPSGSASLANGSFTVRGSGADIWDTADGFHFVSQPLSGDGTITARVSNLQNTHAWAKAGVMIRESTAAGSRHSLMAITPQNGASFQRRQTTNGISTSTTEAGIVAPQWVRLVRSGSTVTGYRSVNGSTWVQVGSDTIAMSAAVRVGLAVTSHQNGSLCTAVFDQVSITTSAPAVNQPPTVALTTPSTGTSVVQGTAITLTANANDADGTVAKVAFYQGSTLIGEDSTSPFSFSWANAATGTHSLTARATDNAGATTTSAAVAITVTAPPASLPAPWIAGDIGSTTPAGSTAHANGTFTLRGAGADIWNTADGFQFMSQSLSGDGTITARVASVQNTHIWAKAGVMIRESTATGSRHALMAVTPHSGTSFQRRLATNGSSTSTTQTGIAPQWVRLVRSGHTVTGYRSVNGSTWIQVGRDTIAMSASVRVGLAVTSHQNGTLCTAVFDQVSVTIPVAHQAPVVPLGITLTDDCYLENGARVDNSTLKVEAGSRVRTSYLRFTVSGMTAGMPISARLRLRVNTDAGSGTLRFHAGSHSTWSQTTITAATAPTATTALAAVTGSWPLGHDVSVDISKMITGNGTYTIMVTMDAGGNDVWFGSKESTATPLLTIVPFQANG